MNVNWLFNVTINDISVPVRTRGVKSRMCPPYPQRKSENVSSVSPACRKRRLIWAVSESPYKKGGPVSVLGWATLKNPAKPPVRTPGV